MDLGEKIDLFLFNLPMDVTDVEIHDYLSQVYIVQKINFHFGYFFDKKIKFNTASIECYASSSKEIEQNKFLRGRKPIIVKGQQANLLIQNSLILMTKPEDFNKLSYQNISNSFQGVQQIFIVYSNYSQYFVINFQTPAALKNACLNTFSCICDVPTILKPYPPSLHIPFFSHAALALQPFNQKNTIDTHYLTKVQQHTCLILKHNDQAYLIPIFTSISVSGFLRRQLKLLSEPGKIIKMEITLSPIKCNFSQFYRYLCGKTFEVDQSMGEAEFRMASYLEAPALVKILENLFYQTLNIPTALSYIEIYQTYTMGLPVLIRFFASHANMDLITKLPIEILKMVSSSIYFFSDNETCNEIKKIIKNSGGTIKDLIGIYRPSQLTTKEINEIIMDPDIDPKVLHMYLSTGL